MTLLIFMAFSQLYLPSPDTQPISALDPTSNNSIFLPLITSDANYPVILGASLHNWAPQDPFRNYIIDAEIGNYGTSPLYHISLQATRMVNGAVYTSTLSPLVEALAPGCLTRARSEVFTPANPDDTIDFLEAHVVSASQSGAPGVVCIKARDIAVANCPGDLPEPACLNITITNDTEHAVENIAVYLRRYHFAPVVVSAATIPARATRTLFFRGDRLDAIFFGLPALSDISAQASVIQ